MRRIQRDKQHEEFIKTLVSGDQAVFREIWRVLLFAAALGVKKGERKPLGEIDSGKAFPESYFNSPGWKGFLYLLGFLDNNTGDHLKNDEKEQDKLATTFEEYANFGLHEISRSVTSSSDPLGQLAELLSENSKGKLPVPDISNLGEDSQL
jgi:dnd system-associated protein 4